MIPQGETHVLAEHPPPAQVEAQGGFGIVDGLYEGVVGAGSIRTRIVGEVQAAEPHLRPEVSRYGFPGFVEAQVDKITVEDLLFLRRSLSRRDLESKASRKPRRVEIPQFALPLVQALLF